MIHTAVERGEARSSVGPLEDLKLMPEREVFEDEGVTGSEGGSERAEYDREHVPRVPGLAGNFNRGNADEFSGRTAFEAGSSGERAGKVSASSAAVASTPRTRLRPSVP